MPPNSVRDGEVPGKTMATTLSRHPTCLFLQLHLPTQLHSPGPVGHRIRNLRWQHRADHPSKQTLVPGAPGRTKERLVSPHSGGGGGWGGVVGLHLAQRAPQTCNTTAVQQVADEGLEEQVPFLLPAKPPGRPAAAPRGRVWGVEHNTHVAPFLKMSLRAFASLSTVSRFVMQTVRAERERGSRLAWGFSFCDLAGQGLTFSSRLGQEGRGEKAAEVPKSHPGPSVRAFLAVTST